MSNLSNYKVDVQFNIPYRTIDETVLTADLYRPAQPAVSPVVIAVHGGGWRQGSPARYANWGEWLAERGIALFAIRYRLAGPNLRFPEPLHDVTEAIGFVRNAAVSLGFDARRIALMGDSAGAQLASLAVLASKSSLIVKTPNANPLSDEPVQAVIGLYGVYDLLAQWEHDQVNRPRDHIVETLLGASAIDDKLIYCIASPFHHTSSQTAKVPFLVAWGTDDDVVDYVSQSKRFVTALKQAGCLVRTVSVVDAPHYWVDQPFDETGSFTGFLV